jgi:hypothetical protein
MKRWNSHLIFIFTLVVISLAGINSYGQEAGMSDLDLVEERSPVGSERHLFSPENPRYVPKVTNNAHAGDSVALQIQDFPMQQAVMRANERSNEKPAEKPGAKPKDDSILTYNFLYYIIQKYKLQDIID